MGEETKVYISTELSIMNLPREDLISMIHLNIRGDLPEALPYETLINICAHGMTYGAMKTICPYCKTIVHIDGERYQCLGKSFIQSTCNYFRYHVHTSNAPWKIPEKITEKEKLNTLKRRCKKYPVVSFLNDAQKKQRNEVIHDIDKYITSCSGHLKSFEGIPYNYFLVINDDLIGNYQKKSDSTGTSSHCFGYILKIVGTPPSYDFYKKEQIYGNYYQHTYRFSKSGQAIEKFKNQFHSITGNTWQSWVDGGFVRTNNCFFPLMIDKFSRINYLEAQKIDEIHEEFVIQFEYLQKLKIDGKKITKLSIQNAQSTTICINANVILKRFKEFAIQGLEQELICATKNLLKFLDDEEGLKFGSIVSRLLNPSGGTTIRLVDLPQKFFLFEPIGKILSVFFKYQKSKQNWPFTSQTWPSSPKKLTQEYMLGMTRDIIGSWIMKFALSSDEQMHHYYVKQKDSGCCYWSVLLRKARKTSDSDCFILCTIDVEELPEHLECNMAKDETFIDKQTDLEEIFLTNIDEPYYGRCGYIHHAENRVKMVMVFPIKYTGRPEELDDDEKETWLKYLSSSYSPVTRPDFELNEKAKFIYKKKNTPSIYLGDADEKSSRPRSFYKRKNSKVSLYQMFMVVSEGGFWLFSFLCCLEGQDKVINQLSLRIFRFTKSVELPELMSRLVFALATQFFFYHLISVYEK